jgi:hypothetical protein
MRLISIVHIAYLLLATAGIAAAQDEETRKHALHTLGGPFIVYRSNVQEELKLSDGQKQDLLGRLPDLLRETLKALQRPEGAEREQEIRSIRQKSYEEFWPILKGTLNGEQFRRMQQLELQHEGPAALIGRPEIGNELKITEGQREQFVGVVQDMRKEMEPLLREARSSGDREGVRLKATKIYENQEEKIEAILNEAQKKQWKEMLGKPFDVFNDN